jgi:hypothetical protein
LAAQNSRSLSPGAIAGIAIGALVVAALLILGILLFVYKNRSNRVGPTAAGDGGLGGDNKPELSGQSVAYGNDVAELDSQNVARHQPGLHYPQQEVLAELPPQRY